MSGPPITVMLTKVMIDCSSFWTIISLHSLLINVFLDILNLNRNQEFTLAVIFIDWKDHLIFFC